MSRNRVATGWSSTLTRVALGSLVFLAVSGLVVTLAPFHSAVEWTVLVHTALGLVALAPIVWYGVRHWQDYRRYRLSDVVLLGYVGAAALLVCLVSGGVVTWQGLLGARTGALWRSIHLYSTVVLVALAIGHAGLAWAQLRRQTARPSPRPILVASLLATVGGGALIAGLFALYPGPRHVGELPADYSFYYGEDRPFAPSLALTEHGGAIDARSLAGSRTCGTAGCHQQILEEWLPSAHRYAAMDPLFQKVQSVMAEQNGPESTRYCGGCHDPISLFSGAKNVLVEDLTALHGYDEGVSCLSCHGIKETDIQGNADYVMTEPSAYLWQWREAGLGKWLSDFLIRTYPNEHLELSKRMFKAPEYCAACHKQFIDAEVNRVGWVQLQNQYDNWKASHWFVEGDPERSVECRECHMPLVDSSDPAAGDELDYNRSAGDGRHRSHRFVAANTLVPELLQLEGWQQQVALTEEWLRGELEIPEIAAKWREGPVVQLAVQVPAAVEPGSSFPVRVVMTANKVGHDFPTGPLDIIQSWIEIHVTDEEGREIFSSGTVDDRHFIAPGSFLFKAEPVDQYGNLIDRHNLWEMVGVRYRRSLFPGYSDSVEYLVDCPSALGPQGDPRPPGVAIELEPLLVDAPSAPGRYRIEVALNYRKVDQYLINFLLGEDSGLTAPIVEMTRVERSVEVQPRVATSTTAPPPRAAGG
ncbi:MAG TPA: multiheme c-type cytochrome [Thermoanaerobaculia bacterium]|nr:multiheme c-type cytochrome [Thermoanaerobaculia bacterium]